MKKIDIVTAIYVQVYAKASSGVEANLGKKNDQDAAKYLSGLHDTFLKALDSNSVK